MTIRNEIYLAVVEAVSSGMNAVLELGNLEVPYDQLAKTYIEKAPAIAKAHLVATEKTAKALIDIATELGSAFQRLMIGRIPLTGLKDQIANKTAQIRSFEQARDAMLQGMRNYNIEGLQYPRKFETLEKNFTFEAGRIKEAVAEQEQLSADLRAKHIDYLGDCSKAGHRVSDLIPAALIAVREELDLSISDDYVTMLQQAQETSKAVMEDYLKELALLATKQASA